MNVTYLFGAGASAQSIPVVRDTQNHFNIFLEYLHILVNDRYDQIPENLKIDVKSNLMDYEISILSASRHLSYDTYAKKLWLKQDFALLKRLKELISLFYYFKNFDFYHIVYKADYEININEEMQFWDPDESTLNNRSEVNKDKRYDAFLAGISSEIKDEKLQLPNNISIISWNYDLQLEITLEEYNMLYNNYIYMFSPIKINGNSSSNYFDNNYIKLNGSASLAINGDISSNDLNKLELVTSNINLSNPNEFIYKLFIEYVKNKNNKLFNPFINFAWKKNIISTKTVNSAVEIMKKTDCLVIIGYSFPLFNREIDKLLFRKLEVADNAKIYIQTISNEEYLGIRSRIRGLVDIEEEKFVYVDDTKQFHVPFELDERKYKYEIRMTGHNSETL